MSPIERKKSQYLLAKSKDDILYIIKSDELIIHRDKNKLKIGDEVSWSGKSRMERGRGKVLAIGTKEQCEATKTVIEEYASTSKPSSTSKTSSALKTSPISKSSSSIEFSSTFNALSGKRFDVPNCSLIDMRKDEISDPKAKSSLEAATCSRFTSMLSSESSISITCLPDYDISKTLSELPILKNSEVSSDITSEAALMIDEAPSDDQINELTKITKSFDA
ncbi:unnamed protein product [Rotaria sp. Silwood1]|nr:unnamed protein product [Rotaria sp. Silwood1]CAF4987656.1 unnamed protein product [Rotaria sp. Silwood1]